MLGSTVITLFALTVVSAAPAKRQEGPLVYAQGSNDQTGASQGSTTYNTASLGCWQDNYPFFRTLNGSFFFEPTYTTPETCSKYCAGLGFTYSGTEDATQCFCGNGLSGSSQIDDAQCNTACQANPAETCGGSNTLSVQKISYIYSEGCFQDIVNYRALDGAYTESDAMTVEYCGTYCSGNGFSYAGLEYATQCFCGNTVRLGPGSGCTTPCSGNSAETCGGNNALSLYSLTGKTLQTSGSSSRSVGCFADYYPATRAFSGPSRQSGDNTNESCQQYCTSQGFPYSGTEYSNECSTAPASNATSTACTMSCSGDASQICGGANGLSVTYFGA
ncbi:Putative uncharacterized protein [Taphrina deformans PYCC 5710]|uniref:WSC domain-containing protein n=1 Tax=Taphrina deformans (strain PYCC 5710 / ATCC 11124 / CBS 356.35 / IMI 108563 / JCM 9778 / NBRC 8474) TaxID=1097556 RepID=R4X846_TAPDE|nr:Putative uncharacterized protein [Taphrina deformans PYCC 5710]|eukprot:CCG81648.1 Putative uncharacterized protein [Taphrina deformans PYCC 5710]